MKTKTQKKLEKVNIKTVSGSEKPWSQSEGVPARCLWRIGFEKKKF